MHSSIVGSVDDPEKCGFIAPLEFLALVYSTMLPRDAHALQAGFKRMLSACSSSNGTRLFL